ncbi:uncharacterized protein LOC121370926 [Gigantopelta aegis]|uniref:uncharacterized protein LOC121370926 n=1 Tax=Gigantopelta aegis TaxID=1735272 RepID=UPI001B88D1E0|nr:uncharacterized protein LOC121370926 [Gigantopelta aegis]
MFGVILTSSLTSSTGLQYSRVLDTTLTWAGDLALSYEYLSLMGKSCSMPLPFSKVPPEIVIVGPNAAGKRFLLYSWLFGVQKSIASQSTKSCNIDETITSRTTGEKFLVHALRGTPSVLIRNKEAYEETKAVVLMINAAGGVDSIHEAQRCLDLITVSFPADNFPVLIVVNAVDAPGALSCDEIETRFDLHVRLANKAWQICSLRESSQEDVDHILRELAILVDKKGPDRTHTN